MEESRIRKLVLFTLHTNERYEFWYKLHLPSAERKTRRGQNSGMHSLRLQRLFGITFAILRRALYFYSSR